MSDYLTAFIEKVNESVTTALFEEARERQALQASFRRPEAVVKTAPGASNLARLAKPQPTRLSVRPGAHEETPAEHAAEAIFKAESVFSAACLQALAEKKATAEEVVTMRDAGDAVLRFAGSALRPYRGWSLQHTALRRLIALADDLPGKKEGSSRAPRHTPNPAPAPCMSAVSSHL